jgi:hypothetical protein
VIKLLLVLLVEFSITIGAHVWNVDVADLSLGGFVQSDSKSIRCFYAIFTFEILPNQPCDCF